MIIYPCLHEYVSKAISKGGRCPQNNRVSVTKRKLFSLICIQNKNKSIIISRAKVHITATNNGNVHFYNLTRVGLKTGPVGQSESS